MKNGTRGKEGDNMAVLTNQSKKRKPRKSLEELLIESRGFFGAEYEALGSS